ncbi:MAG: hypothetical protein KJ967_06540 [Elusimicrobia bacterium]|nr:hypothetical protein [Elusimicrobiota bacterium]
MDKKEVLREYLEYLDRKIGETQKALDSIYHGIDTAPTPSESHSDTTRSQQSKIAAETSDRISSLKKTRAMASLISSEGAGCIGVGALVAIEDISFGGMEYYFVVPGQGGESLFLGDAEVMSISLQAPILEAISSAKERDLLDFRGRKLKLVSIS